MIPKKELLNQTNCKGIDLVYTIKNRTTDSSYAGPQYCIISIYHHNTLLYKSDKFLVAYNNQYTDTISLEDIPLKSFLTLSNIKNYPEPYISNIINTSTIHLEHILIEGISIEGNDEDNNYHDILIYISDYQPPCTLIKSTLNVSNTALSDDIVSNLKILDSLNNTYLDIEFNSNNLHLVDFAIIIPSECTYRWNLDSRMTVSSFNIPGYYTILAKDTSDKSNTYYTFLFENNSMDITFNLYQSSGKPSLPGTDPT